MCYNAWRKLHDQINIQHRSYDHLARHFEGIVRRKDIVIAYVFAMTPICRVFLVKTNQKTSDLKLRIELALSPTAVAPMDRGQSAWESGTSAPSADER